MFGIYNSLVQFDSDTYALAYAGDGSDGFIKTFTISADGSTITEVATIEHDTSKGLYNSLVQVDSDTYALAYTGDVGAISTFTLVNVLDDPDTIAITDVITTTITTPTESTQAFSTSGNLSFNDATVTTTGSGSVTIEKLNSNPESSSPSGTVVGSFFDITSTGTLSDRTVTLSYSDAEVSGVDESSLTINRFSGGTWSALTTTVDTSANTATATTPGFSSFVLSGTSSSSSSSSSSSGGGHKTDCDSKGFGVGKSLKVYQISYDLESHRVEVHAYSTCGTISAEVITSNAKQLLGLLMDQPYLNEKIIVYSAYLDESVDSFTINLTNKRNTFSEKFFIHDKSILKTYSGTTGYTSEQQGSFSGTSGYTSEQQGTDSTNTQQVPEWIKNNAKWWSDGQIGDSDFTSGIQFMIKEKIINIPDLPEQASETAEQKVPDWIRNNAGWWSDGLITEDDFVKGIQYLVEQGIIKV